MNNQRVLEPTTTGMPVRIRRRVHALWRPPLCTSTLPPVAAASAWPYLNTPG